MHATEYEIEQMAEVTRKHKFRMKTASRYAIPHANDYLVMWVREEQRQDGLKPAQRVAIETADYEWNTSQMR